MIRSGHYIKMILSIVFKEERVMKMTSASAQKIIRKLKDEKAFLESMEEKSYLFSCIEGEEKLIPEYDYKETSEKIKEIDEQVIKIKHAVNVVNSTREIKVNGKKYTVDAILVRMAQLNSRLYMLDIMRSKQPKTRLGTRYYNGNNQQPEYQYINYDLAEVKKDYETINNEIATMQLELDKFNQTYEFEVDYQ